MGAMGMEAMEDMADTVHMTALTIMGPPLFLTATEMRLPGRELLIWGVVPAAGETLPRLRR